MLSWFRVNIKGLGSKERQNALNEVRILASLNHSQIIGYKEAFYEESTFSLCIVMEFAEGGDLQKVIDTAKKTKDYLSEEKIWQYAIQMISGIKYLHDMGITHRDLKVRTINGNYFIKIFYNCATSANKYNLTLTLTNYYF